MRTTWTLMVLFAWGPVSVEATAAQIQRAPAPPAKLPALESATRPPVRATGLVGYNDRDGFMTVAWVHVAPSADDSVWFALGTGWKEPGRTPSVLEAGLRSEAGFTAWFKHTEGRRGFGASYTFTPGAGLDWTIAAEEAAVVDEEYLRPIFFFRCPGDAPAAPCDSAAAPFDWSRERDRAAEVRLTGRRGVDVAWSAGLRAAPEFVGDAGYVQARLEAVWAKALGDADLEVRWAAAWTSRGTPLQSRFFVHGAGPLARWENPYLRSRGSPLDRLSYFAPGGAHLRAYARTAPLVRRFVAVAARAERAWEWSFLRGAVGLFGEAAWLPGTPDVLGRSQMTPEAPFVFLWPRLTPGEDRPGGEFSAEVFHVSDILADAGLAVALRVPPGVQIEASLPVWASEPSLADRAHDLFDPFGDGKDRSLGWRWTLTLRWSATALAREQRDPLLRGF